MLLGKLRQWKQPNRKSHKAPQRNTTQCSNQPCTHRAAVALHRRTPQPQRSQLGHQLEWELGALPVLGDDGGHLALLSYWGRSVADRGGVRLGLGAVGLVKEWRWEAVVRPQQITAALRLVTPVPVQPQLL